MIIYQIYPRSFYDANGDGLGDLEGIYEKLPYIARLGVDALWISPFVQSPQKDFGYDVSDYCAVDPRFGTLADFRRVVNRAHTLKLKVIMDQVWCHCSDVHPWFKESRASTRNAKADWFIWADAKADGSPPNNWLSYFGGSAWTWDTRRQQYYFHQFLESQPTFNLRHKGVRKALLEVGAFWLKLGVDGFRLDAIHTGFADPALRNNPARPRHMPPAPDVPASIPQARQIRLHSEAHKDALPFLEEIRALADRHGAFLLGEVNGENPYARSAEYTRGQRLHRAYNFGLLKGRPDAASFRQSVVMGEKNKGSGHFAYALSNHDVPRVASRWSAPKARDEKAVRAALLFGLTLPGDYCMYQGEELGLTEADIAFKDMQDPFGIAFYPEFKGRDGCRTPMPWKAKAPHAGFSPAKKTWLPVAREHRAYAVDRQEYSAASTLAFARKIIVFSKESMALQEGAFVPLKTKGSLIAFKRSVQGETLLCVFNTADKPGVFALKEPGMPLFGVGMARQKNRIIFRSFGAAVFRME